MNRRAFVLTGTMALLAPAVGVRAQSDPPPQELEPIHAALAGRRGLTIRVNSHGCTRKGDFAYFVERKGAAVTVAFGRKRIDRCGKRLSQADLAFSYDELGISKGEDVVVLNPLSGAVEPFAQDARKTPLRPSRRPKRGSSG
jgi:hypothetical protein